MSAAVIENPAGARLGALDGLRGIGALVVMVVHYVYRGPSLYPEIGASADWTRFGGYGIGFFFMVSGFVILMSLQRSTVKRFALGRFIRLYPAYWVCLILTFTVLAVFGLPGRDVTVGQFLVNLTMLQSYVGVPPVDAAYWTLGVELAFYVQCTIALALGLVRGRGLDIVMALGLAVSLLVILADHTFDTPFTGALLQAFGWTGYVLIGAAFFRFWSGERGRVVLVVIPLSIGVIATREPAEAVAALILSGVMVLALWGPDIGLGSRPLRWLGGISYVLYLLHQNVGYVALRAWSPVLGQVPATIIVSVGMIALAAGVAYLVDAPVRRLLRSRLLAPRVPV